MPDKPKLLILSSSLLTDRTLLFTDLISKLSDNFDIKVWATSFNDEGMHELWLEKAKDVEQFPEIKPVKFFPYNYLRRVNEYAWDLRLKPACKISHDKLIKKKQLPFLSRFSYLAIAEPIAKMNLIEWSEKRLNSLFMDYQRSEESAKRLETYKPDVVLSMGYMWVDEQAVLPNFIKKNIPIIAYTASWDNPFTMPRFLFDFCAYIVWNEQMHKHLNWYYPHTTKAPNYLTGAPQFDILYNKENYVSREEFCAENNLNPTLPIIVYAAGSPYQWSETNAMKYIAQKVHEGYFGKVNFLIRPHPLNDPQHIYDKLTEYNDSFVIQQTSNKSKFKSKRNLNAGAVKSWVNTFVHADVVVNSSSTAAIDGAVLDKPIVNLDFDPGITNDEYVKEFNHKWEHFKPVAESDGLWLVKDLEEMVHATKTYLENPSLHKEGRRNMAMFVCNNPDGKSAERLANTVKIIYNNLNIGN